MIARKSRQEIAIMKEGGSLLGIILKDLIAYASVGMECLDIESRAQALIRNTGGTPSFQTVHGYSWATCICINDEVVHGIPTKRKLNNGDMLTIDIGLLYGGFHTDTAWTKIIGNDTSPEKEGKIRFLDIGLQTLIRAIDLCKVGNHVGDISESNQKNIEAAGYSIVKTLVGHGVGKELHEDPQIPNYSRGNTANTYKFQGGETIAIEPIYAQGQGTIVYANDDGWTLATRDGSYSAVFEHSIAITEDGPLILTA